MNAEPRAVEQFTRRVRACFQALRALGDALHADVGVTAAMRAILEWLAEHPPETVANIARAKTVSRQHVQQLVDTLVAAGLAETRENPAHKRSPLVALTGQGRAVFDAMRRREKAVLRALAARLDAAAVAEATVAVETLAAAARAETEALQEPTRTMEDGR